MKEQNTYISAHHDRKTDDILVWERPVGGGARVLKRHRADWYFYVPDENGEKLTITGERVSKRSFETREEFEAGLKVFKRRFESDVQPLARFLMERYYGLPTPVPYYAFFDIEVDYDSKKGFSSPENPYAPINAVTIYQSWSNKYLTYAVPPKKWRMTQQEFKQKIEASWAENKLGFIPHVELCKNEAELLAKLVEAIEEADIISGWNSEFFDNPYVVKRLERLFGKRGTAFMCFDGAPPPMAREVDRFGSKALTYTLYGRSHLDYLDLFKKFTFEGRTSYSLANIAAEELDVPKLDYDGTLEELYNNDFVHFVTYNARDVEVLVKLDQKFKLMHLVNQMAHENTVPYLAILGTVRYVETGIMNRAHNVHGLICTDKSVSDQKNKKVEGAIVMTPLAGLHRWIGSVDITSLYPSVIRALNMSVETFIGQFTDPNGDEDDPEFQLYGERAWFGIKHKDNTIWHAETVSGSISLTGAEWHKVLRELGYAISAFGTIFDQSKPGMVADTLTFWFAERKRLQAEKKKYAKLAKEETDPIKKAEYQRLEEHFDLLQLTKKIQLNSTYGALLNEAFRFGRREIGASVTGTGRQISIHMGQTIGELVTGQPCVIDKRYAFDQKYGNIDNKSIAEYRRDGEFDKLDALSKVPVLNVSKKTGEAEDDEDVAGAVYYTRTNEIIYGDTDSCYFMTRASNYDEAVAIADEIAEQTNASFPQFMAESFNCTDGRECLIKAAREVVAESGLFLLAKKKYTLKVVNLDGVDLRAKPKLKSMGSEIKKADTPKAVQQFLKGLMDLVLAGKSYDDLEKFVNSSRGTLIRDNKDVLTLGVAKQINNLDNFHAAWLRAGKKDGKVMMAKDNVIVPTNVPGHVRAAINYNELVQYYQSTNDKLLHSGDKGIIFYLKPNQHKFKAIAFPADMMHLPAWFTENFKIDLRVTEEKMIDSKVAGIFEAMRLQTPTPQTAYLNSVFTF